MKVYEAVAKAVATEGIELLFTFMDSSTIELVQALSEEGIRVYHTRHEQGAVCMADGYSRATGTLGMCTVGAGPALAQTGTGLVTARKGRSPVLVISGDMPAGERNQIKYFDQRSYVESTAGNFVPLRKPATVAADVQQAFRYVRARRGPTVLNAPADILRSDIPGDWKYIATSAMPGPFRVTPDQEAVESAAAILATARRPVILAGKGAVLSGARAEIEALASRVGALLGTSLLAQELFRGHPFHIGVLGDFASDPAVELLAQADCVLAIGASLNPYTTGGGRLAPRATVIHIDQDPARFNEVTPIELGIQGDAQATVAAINACLEMAGISERASYWSSDHLRESIQACCVKPPPPAEEPSQPIHPANFLAELDKILPKDRTIILGAGVPRRDRGAGFVFDYITVPDAESMIRTGDFGSIGLGMSAGIGAALARPDSYCVAFEGDGGFIMHLQELETAVRYQVPLTIVVMNDAAYGAEVIALKALDKPATLALADDVDFAGVARALNARGVTVRSMSDMDTVAAEIRKKDGPLVLDVKIKNWT